ncbi:PIN domain-containing protein [Oscillospiraceae bacterium OttesenSCG-928-F05]|nr:PIN domain-containing protein [Oscillospiraceae bacterium OttesenSCG-928-F05]
MRKKKIYLDTSVISYLRQEDAPKEMLETQEFWTLLKMGKYDVYISEVTTAELLKCAEPKRTELLDLLDEIQYKMISVHTNSDIIGLSEEIKKYKLLPPNSENDRFHIAAAMHSECNIIVSWNFKHLVNVKTIEGVRVIALLNNLPQIDIYSPTVLLERRERNE